MKKDQELIMKINTLKKQQIETLNQLACSLAIRKMWPEVKFPSATYIAGSPSKGCYFYIVCNKGKEKKQFEILDVPDVLIDRPHIQKGISFIEKHCGHRINSERR